jgi:hypothetical protein
MCLCGEFSFSGLCAKSHSPELTSKSPVLQRSIQYRRTTDDLGFPAVQELCAERRRARGFPDEERWRRHSRQDQCAVGPRRFPVLQRHLRDDYQSVGPRPLSWRLFRRIRCGPRRRLRTAVVRAKAPSLAAPQGGIGRLSRLARALEIANDHRIQALVHASIRATVFSTSSEAEIFRARNASRSSLIVPVVQLRCWYGISFL